MEIIPAVDIKGGKCVWDLPHFRRNPGGCPVSTNWPYGVLAEKSRTITVIQTMERKQDMAPPLPEPGKTLR